MIDVKLLRSDIKAFSKSLERHNYVLNIDEITPLEEQRKSLQTETQELQNKRNALAKAIGQAKGKGEDASELLLEAKGISQAVEDAEEAFSSVQEKLQAIYAGIPNVPHESVPAGNKEEDNLELRRWGNIPQFNFKPKDHVDLGAKNGSMDFEVAAKLSGSRFVVLKDKLAMLHRALTQFMLDVHTQEHGYTEIYVPYLVNSDSLYGTGQLPKFAEDQFEVKNEHGNTLHLIPTAEVPVTNLLRGEIVDASELPLKYACHTPCFRSEAGSYGRDTRGMIRQHQFEKVEMVQFVHPDKSYEALEELTSHAETILQKLALPYRVMVLCGGDLGFSAAKTYDLEVWLPSQDCYREISSCSNMESFQARRMQARWRNPETRKPELLHTLNGSGLAVGRTLVALLENYQDEAGNIHLPEVLHPYMKGVTQI